MSFNKRRAFTFALVLLIVLTLCFIWGNSLLDSSSSTELSNGLLVKLRPFLAMLGIELEDDLLLRKLAHFCEFFALGSELAALMLLWNQRRVFLCCSCISALAGLVDETIQFFTGRYSHVHDVLLDSFGGICGTLATMLIIAFIIRKKTGEI